MKNPFTAGNWVRGDNFFGRERIINEILESDRHFLWITGTRRLGKTSLLKQVEMLTDHPPYRDRYISLFWDLQGALNLEGLSESLLESIEDVEDKFEAVGIDVGELEEKTVFEIIRILRRAARDAGLTLLLLCDECEELINVERNNPEALPRLRRTLQKTEHLKTVLSATKRLFMLESEDVPDTSPFLYGFLPPVYLGRLEPEAAVKLIERGDFKKAEVDKICSLTDNHPYLIQLLCRRTFESGSLDNVIDEVQNDEMVSHFFSVDFEYLDVTEKQVIWHVLNQQRISEAELLGMTAFEKSNLSKLLQGLTHLGYLKREDDQFRLPNFFFERWLQREKERLFGDSVSGEQHTRINTPLLSASLDKALIGQKLEHYHIREHLGSGGMAAVFRAVDTRLERDVALKVLAPIIGAEESVRDRFNLEARAASSLNHPNIATIYQIGEANGLPFIAMEYVSGGTLTDWNRNPERTLAERLDIAQQIAAGLNHAHQDQVIHRDIKPDNILVSERQVAKITDFGLARMMTENQRRLTKTGATMGTLRYMSPEQAASLELDHRSDIFSYGVLLFELLTGELPFAGDNEVSYLYAIINEAPRRSSDLTANITPDLDRVLQKVLEKDRDQRYQDMNTLIEDLTEATNKI